MHAVAARALALALFCIIAPRQGSTQRVVSLGDTVAGTIHRTGFADAFALDLPAGTALHVTIGGELPRVRWARVALSLPDRQILYSNPDAIDGTDRNLWYAVRDSGRYVIDVNWIGPGNSSDSASYQLTFGTGIAPPAPGEPTRLIAPNVSFRLDGLTSDAAGKLFATDGNFRLLTLDSHEAITTFASIIYPGEIFQGPLEVDGFGDLLVGGYAWNGHYTGVIWRYSRSGERTVFATNIQPASIALAPDGGIWAADDNDGRIVHYDPLGVVQWVGTPPINCEHGPHPQNLIFSPNKVLHFTSCGGVYSFAQNTPTLVVRSAIGLAFDQNGFLYVGSLWQPAIGLLDAGHNLVAAPLVRNLHASYYLTATFDGTAGSRRLLVGAGWSGGADDPGQVVQVNSAGIPAPGYNPVSRFALEVTDVGRLVAPRSRIVDTLHVLNASGPVSWSIRAGSLPAGLTLDEQTGVISGTVSDSGSFTFAVRAASGDQNGFGHVSIISSSTSPLALVSDSTLRQGRAGVPYVDTLRVAGGTGTYDWQLTEGVLPPGFSLDSRTGVISGTATFPYNWNFEVTVVSGVQTIHGVFRLRVAPNTTLEAVMAQLLGQAKTLTEEDVLYLDNIGNQNRRLDIGDVLVWLKQTAARP